MIVLILSVFITDVIGEEEIKYTNDQDGNEFYYDKDSIKRKSGIMKVWETVKFSNKNQLWRRGVDLCSKYSETNPSLDCNRLSHIKFLTEINCEEDMRRFISVVDYDEDGRVLYSKSFPSQQWDYIISGSLADTLKNIICK
jgi:hypothetical protein